MSVLYLSVLYPLLHTIPSPSQVPPLVKSFTQIKRMSAAVEHNEELIDYEEDEALQVSAPVTTTLNTGASGSAATAAVKKGYVGIHSTGFRDFLLKPELLRAIGDCGFEHPSEGKK